MLICKQWGTCQIYEVGTEVPTLVHLGDMVATRPHASFAVFWRFLCTEGFTTVFRRNTHLAVYICLLSDCAETEASGV